MKYLKPVTVLLLTTFSWSVFGEPQAPALQQVPGHPNVYSYSYRVSVGQQSPGQPPQVNNQGIKTQRPPPAQAPIEIPLPGVPDTLTGPPIHVDNVKAPIHQPAAIILYAQPGVQGDAKTVRAIMLPPGQFQVIHLQRPIPSPYPGVVTGPVAPNSNPPPVPPVAQMTQAPEPAPQTILVMTAVPPPLPPVEPQPNYFNPSPIILQSYNPYKFWDQTQLPFPPQ